MKISINIILDVLNAYRLETYLTTDKNIFFSTCLPLPDKTEELDPAFLYIGKLSKAMSKRHALTDFYCLCLRDRVKDDEETETSLSNFIVINENISLTTLLSQVQKRFFEVQDWVHHMNETLIHGGSMQDIVDIGASLLDNYIAISDASLMLMAYSKNIYCDDPVSQALVEYGYHPEETIQKFRKNNMFTTWQKENTIYIDDTLTVAKYIGLNKIFRFRDTYFAHVVMTCNRHAPTAGTKDLFQLFLDVLSVHVEKVWETKSNNSHVYDSLFVDLIEGNVTGKNAIEERAQYVNIPMTGMFCLFQIVPSDSVNMSIGKMQLDFSDLFPRLIFTRHQNRIVAMNQFYEREDIEDQLKTICTSLENFLEKYDATCGVSPFFKSLTDVKHAYNQTTMALNYIKRLHGKELCMSLKLIDPTESRIHYFSRIYVFCLLGDNDINADLWFHSDHYQMLYKIYQHDLRQKTNSMQMLSIFLDKERSATETGSILNMHRNNVLYHIKRIEESLGISFDDTKTRFMTQLSFYLLELYGFKND